MSLNFTTDNSVQLTYTSFPFTTPPLDGYTTSNYVSNISNLLINNINTKQATLTAATNLLGVGTAITAIDYNKITVNKPSTFPADMTNIYSKTETNNLLSAKEATLTFSSPLTRTTNTIGINLSSYSTTGNDASYLLKTGGTMTGAIVNTSATASDFKGIYIMHAARQSHLPYIPDGQFYFRAPVIIDNPADFLSFGSRIGDNFLRLYGADFGFGINSGTLRYNVPMGSVHRFYHGATNTAWIDDTGRLKATIFEGSGAALTNLPLSAYSTTGNDASYLLKTGGTLTGTLNGPTINATTALQEAGTNLTSKYLQLSGGNMTANANITLSGTGTFTGIHSGNGAALTNLPLSAYSTTGNDASYVLKTGSTMTGNLTVNADLILKNSVWHRSIDGVYRFYYGLNDVSYYCCGSGSTEGHIFMDSAYNHRFKIKNNGNIEVSGTISEAGTLLTSKYLQLTGGNMTGTLNLLPTTGITPLYIYSTAAASINNIELKNNANNSCYIGIGGTSYTGYYINNLFLQSPNSLILNTGGTGTGSTPKMIINNSGNVGIATTNPTELLNLYSIGTNNAFIKADAGGGTGQSGLRLFAGSNTSNRATRIDFFNNVASTSVPRWSILNDTDQNGTNDFRIFSYNPNANNVLTLLQSGFIGIGTLTPQTNLEIFHATNPKIFLNQNGTTRCFISGNSLGLDLGNDVGTSKIIRFMPDNVERMRIDASGNVGIGTNNPRSLLHIKGTNTTLTIMGQGGSGAKSQINLSTYDHTTNLAPCSLIATDNGSFGSTFQINQKTPGADTNAQFISFIIYPSGNVGINTNNPQYKLQVEGTTYFNGASIVNGNMQCSKIIANSGTSEFTNSIYIFNPFGRTTHFPFLGNNENYIRGKVNIDQDDLYVGGATTISGRTYCNGGLNIQVNSWVYDTNGAQRIYFGSGARTYYQGYGQYTTDINHEWRNHVGTGVMFLSYTGTLLLEGEIVPLMASVANSGTDYCGVTLNSSQGTNYKTSIKIMFGTFTGFHRCFTDDIEYNQEEPQKFKDDYIGRIVVSTGKIATDTKTENDEEWTIKYDKEGISIEDALPIIQLSRTKKDKRVFGVLGMPSRNNSRVERMIVNSVGEGAIWVANSNGNIENGDYITSSDYLGYGEKQDDDLLHNYTVAKATIECNFELDSPYYECQELEEGIRVAFIACTYHCG